MEGTHETASTNVLQSREGWQYFIWFKLKIEDNEYTNSQEIKNLDENPQNHADEVSLDIMLVKFTLESSWHKKCSRY